MSESSNRREGVKSAAIIFLAVMLVLTLFSNTIMNYSLPEVSTQMMMGGRLDYEVRGIAVVEGTDPYVVTMEKTGKLASVSVNSGDTVEAGAVLMVLEPAESEELKAARARLEELTEGYRENIIRNDLLEEAEAVENGTAGSYEENYAKLAAKKAEIEAAEAANDAAGAARLKEEYQQLRESILSIMELQKEYQKIRDQKAVVSELENNTETVEVTAPISGTVAAVHYRAGQTVPAGETVIVLQRPDSQCTMRMTVTAKQASLLRVGAAAEIVSKWRYPDVEAVISEIYTNVQNPEQKIIEFAVTGEVLDGESIELSVSVSSGEFDLLVPNSALREDNNGSFVLVLQAKQSPLGTRYTATRLDVEILAADDYNSAVSALADMGQFVITTANQPVEAGELVRLAD